MAVRQSTSEGPATLQEPNLKVMMSLMNVWLYWSST